LISPFSDRICMGGTLRTQNFNFLFYSKLITFINELYIFYIGINIGISELKTSNIEISESGNLPYSE
jgi:hypothetical protein